MPNRTSQGKGWESNKKVPTIVIHPIIFDASRIQRTPALQLEEAVSLTQAISLEVVYKQAIRIKKVNPATLMGGGVLANLKNTIEETQAELFIVNHILTPIQQRNLERELGLKVLDRTGLILEIFGARARTHEGRLQVSLAALTFQRSRLVRSWTHLERQRGGAGFMGGPGERQLEIDRRLIDARVEKLKKRLESVRKTRNIQRRARSRVPYPIVALVGYTNAGKSTLFNLLTGASVMAEDQLFATLDPTMRAIELLPGRKVILSDTVGFISDLPTDLIVSFRATLEEVQQADVIVHVRDISHPETDLQKQDVESILQELDVKDSKPIIEVLNKIDLLDEESQEYYLKDSKPADRRIGISAMKNLNIEKLKNIILTTINLKNKLRIIHLEASNGAALSWIYQHGNVIKRQEEDMDITLDVQLSDRDFERFKHKYAPSSKTEPLSKTY